MSMTPAFSPGPWITQGALVGSVRRWIFEDLYEQCSFHIAEKMPSSVKRRRAADQRLEDALVLVRLEAVRGDERGGDFGTGLLAFHALYLGGSPRLFICHGRVLPWPSTPYSAQRTQRRPRLGQVLGCGRWIRKIRSQSVPPR